MTNYTDIALESLLRDSRSWRMDTAERMIQESEFILSSLENGCVMPVEEAITKETAQKVISMLKQFLTTVTDKFKGKVADYYERYIPWVEKNAAAIKENAAKSTITLAPYWKGQVEKDRGTLTNLPGNAFKIPYEANDVSFASAILPSIKSADDLKDTGKISNLLKNKYRFGVEEEDTSKIQKVELKENALASQIDEMIKYVTSYKSISDALSGIAKNWENLAKVFEEKDVQESLSNLTKDTYLLIESTVLSSTDLALLEGFAALPSALMELDAPVPAANNDKQEPLTKVENNTEPDKKPVGEHQERYRLADKFVRLAFSAFMTACEERFIVYIKVMSQVLGESPKGEKKKQ